MFLEYFLILFICYLPAYLVLLVFLKRRYDGYAIRTHMVSYLATSPEPWRSVFNVATILYGVMSLVLPAALFSMPDEDLFRSLGAVFLLGAGVATILVGFFPMDRKLRIHNVVGFLAFLSVLLTGIVFSVIFRQGLFFSPVLFMINSAVILLAVLLVLSLLFRPQNSSILEWILMFCTIAWNFMLSMAILDRMS
jgi:hypothetical protein